MSEGDFSLNSVFVISSGSCIELNRKIPFTLSRIFVSQDIYLYGDGLLVSRDGGSTFISIGTLSRLGGVCQTSGSGSVFSTITVVGGGATWSGATEIAYSTYPEVVWSSGSPIPAGFNIVDMVADYNGEVGILIGNSLDSSAPRIMRSVGGEPFAFVQSDAGIPQSSGSMAIITDIEICE